jgi:hypothetical protein
MSLLSQVKRLWNGGVIQDVLGAPTFLRDDLPSDATPFSKATQELGRRACRQVARTPSIAYGNQMFWSGMCDPYLDTVNEGPTSDGELGPPFTGGQCQGIKYSVSASGTYTQSNQCTNPNSPSQQLPWSFSRNCNAVAPIFGPITGTTEFNAGNGLVGVRINWINPDGSPANTALFSNNCSLKGGYSINNLTVTRCDGQPDNCGNLPNEYEPPRYPTGLPPLSPPTNDLPGLGDGWDVTINPDGTFNVCVGSECTPDINPDGAGGDPSEDPGEPDGDPKENDPSDPSDDTIEGCAEEGNILTGIKINFTQIPQNVSGPLDYYYRVCYVGFGPDLDLIDLVIDGKLVRDGQFVIPDSEFCKCFRVVVSPGWGLSVQAYSRPEKEE